MSAYLPAAVRDRPDGRPGTTAPESFRASIRLPPSPVPHRPPQWSPSGRALVPGMLRCLFRAARRCLFGWAAEKAAGGVRVGHRVGVVDVEDQGKVERVGAGGRGFDRDEGDRALIRLARC